MKTELSRPKTDRRTFFEIFLLLAAFLSLSARLPDLHKNKPNHAAVSETSSSYLWGRGEDGLCRLFMTEKNKPLPAGVQPESMPEELKLLFYQPMDINRVSEELLQTVPGIGQELAARIARRRREIGGFSKMEDLLEVHGIGSGKLRRLCRYLTVDDRT